MRLYPIRAIARLVIVTSFEASSRQGVRIRSNPKRIIIILVVVLCQVIYLAIVTVIVGPLHRHSNSRRTIICHGIISVSLELSCLRTSQLIPSIVRITIAVLVLHHPYDARFRRTVEGIAYNAEIVRTIIVDAMVEADDQITSEST